MAGSVPRLTWLGIDWDEGPYRQSQRGEHYQAALDELWSNGYLYACDCTRGSAGADEGQRDTRL